MLKPTESRDGRKRINRRVTFRLGPEDFESILCLKYREHDLDDDGPLPELPKQKILELVDDCLRYKADDRHWWTDDVDDDDFRDALREWASDLVRRKFPEFY
ncbi:hypothetical protein ACFW2V_13885 [Streptomyces sp. NPDC058947]|uniref:hypothetical protein n=1 Tax=Streptomyces sp. NPDC058947 TaxID=3346675 RepID=UPI003680DB57